MIVRNENDYDIWVAVNLWGDERNTSVARRGVVPYPIMDDEWHCLPAQKYGFWWRIYSGIAYLLITDHGRSHGGVKCHFVRHEEDVIVRDGDVMDQNYEIWRPAYVFERGEAGGRTNW